MAGIYIHIPFCKSRCIYCDFYSTTQLQRRNWYVTRLIKEMGERRDYLGSVKYNTLYIGGGTPSQLTNEQLSTLTAALKENFPIDMDAEFTIEVNPDDVTSGLIRHLASLGVNRVSMGIQTFDDRRLRFLHRRHSASQARLAVETCRREGISNISIDLMFGFPGETFQQWENDIDEALKLDVPHISAYSLMYEEGTVLTRMIEEGAASEIDDELSSKMYSILMHKLKGAGYLHYEISNFCRPGFHSRHNSSYWDGTPYIGLGAGAHSFDGKARQWNGKMQDDGWKVEGLEVLTPDQQFNEKVMTGLRTSTGINIKELSSKFPSQFAVVKKYLECHITNGNLQYDSSLSYLSLTEKGLFISNAVMSDLMISE